MNNPPPLVTVVIPVYNKAATVARAIRSVKAQTFQNWECFIVDNNSTDNPYPVVMAEIADDSRFAFTRCAVQGVAHARNHGIALGDGPYVVCLDADDEIKPTFLATCVRALVADNSLAIAYTKLEAVEQNGQRSVSQWPGHYDFNEFLRGKNPVPTCCMFRRSFWERVGGYRQRYAPYGAGAEDVEFWLRIGAAGGRAELVSNDPLFVYYLGGAVSGNKAYQEADWRAGKPWVQDGQHPFASLASPANGIAHLVRQVDEPEVSVVIPCGPDHVAYLWDALDSVEGQNLRRWQCIVVYDGDAAQENAYEQVRLQAAFPAVTFANTGRRRGAGAARNVGAELAKAPLLLFLDADDWLEPDALAQMMNAYGKNEGDIIYSDYVGYAYIEDAVEIQRLARANRLLHYDERRHQAVVRYFASDYRCEEAQAQPDPSGRLYIWNVISSLVPKQYHLEIGGFDEQMESWEDWDYWLRMARAGKCFTRVPEPLLNYRFYTGTRRQSANPVESGDFGRQLSGKLLRYMTDKYGRSTPMPCSGCSGKRTQPPPPAPRQVFNTLNEGRVRGMSSADMVEVVLNDGNEGEHHIVFDRVSYGYRKHGDKFEMQAAHARLDKRVVIVSDRLVKEGEAVEAPTSQKARPETPPPPPPPAGEEEDLRGTQSFGEAVGQPAGETVAVGEPPKPEKKETVIKPQIFDFASLWGINEDKAKILVDAGVRTLTGLTIMEASHLAKLIGVAEPTAKNILVRAQQKQS